MPVDSSFLTSGSEIEFPGSAAAFNLGTEPMVSPGGDEGIPDWLADAKHGTAAAPTPPPEIIEPAVPIPDIGELLRPDSMPDWLRKPAETELKTTPEDLPIPKAAATENLEQAELPRWLEAMRPIQSVAVATEDEERVESVGPLAGLRGVLSAEPVVAMPHRPGIMAGNIDTTPGQVAMADMLRRLVIEPEVRAARRAARSLSATPLIRRAMAAVLLLAVFFPLYGGALFSQPGFLPSASLTAGAIVNNLPADRPVLAAFEYDASTASELESGAIALLAHISSRGVPIAIISTQPNGINLAEGLFVYSGVPAGILPTHEKIFNLGYLPGGAAGLRALASNLRGAVNVPESWWSQAPLSSILSVGDFSMVLVIASRPQTVRDWVEQVHTAAPNTPMVAVVSAASDALVYPYTQGSKPSILGMVAGYAGAQAYHNMFLQGAASPPGAEARWQAFGMGSLVSILLLAAGMIGSLVAGRIRKTRKAGE